LKLGRDHGLMPVAIEMLEAAKPSIQIAVNKFRRVATGQWVPIGARIRSFDGNGMLIFETTLRIEESRSRWNEPVKEQEFVLGFPQGSRVSDLIHGQQFVTGDSDTGGNIEALLKSARGVIHVNTSGPRKAR